ncbi:MULTISPECIES: potassium channel protein [Streptomyces]|uniref:potassium channel protein n=1 Tax=Streptomyces TaxID=1883 RepID=UPI00068DE5AB|nr:MULTISPECIES: potassium channel family protein [Streptomyces]
MSRLRRTVAPGTEPWADAGIVLPARRAEPAVRQVGSRLLLALAVLAATTLIVYLDRDGYNDNAGGGLSLLDAAYYATVTLSTTGYGDITPYSDSARLGNIFLITPLRVVFLIITATVVAAVREDENAPLLRQSGADVVVTSSSSAGRLLGLSMLSPHAGAVMEDLLTYGNGLDVVERPVTRAEAGHSPRACEDLVVAVVRGRRVLNYTEPEAAVLQLTDRVIVIKSTG